MYKLLTAFTAIAIAVFIVFGLNSCTKDTVSSPDYGINPAFQQSLLCKSLRLQGNNIDGKMPVGTGIGAPVVVDHPTQVEISAGVQLLIPYNVSNPSKVCNVYLQIEGADNYWETELLTDPSSGRPYFDILIPRFVLNGDFNIIFSIADCNGNISIAYSTESTVSPVADCNLTIKGNVGITVRLFDLGDRYGNARFKYDMYSISDRLDIKYNGTWVASTGSLLNQNTILPNCTSGVDGFVSGQGMTPVFQYDPNKSRYVHVYVSGCHPDTAWEVTPICP